MVTIVSLSEENQENQSHLRSPNTEIKQDNSGREFTSGTSESAAQGNEVRWVFTNNNSVMPQTSLHLVEETANYKFFEEIDEENDYKFYKAICAKKTGTFVQVGGKVSLHDGGVGIVAGLARSPYRAIEAFIYNNNSEKLSVVAFGRVSVEKDNSPPLSNNSLELQKAFIALNEWKKKNGTRKHKRKEDKREDAPLSFNPSFFSLPPSSPMQQKEGTSISTPQEGLKRSFKEIILQEIHKSENHEEEEVERATKYKKLETITAQLLSVQQAEITKMEKELKEKQKQEKEQLEFKHQQESQHLLLQKQQLQQQHKQQLSILQQMFSK